jgi:hypothetical protein
MMSEIVKKECNLYSAEQSNGGALRKRSNQSIYVQGVKLRQKYRLQHVGQYVHKLDRDAVAFQTE